VLGTSWLAGGIAAAALAGSAALAAGVDDADPLRAFDHLIVIYEENHSFDNLYGEWEPVLGQQVEGLAAARHTAQVDQFGVPIGCLLQSDANLVPSTAHVHWLDGSVHPGRQAPRCHGVASNGVAFDSHFVGAGPFSLTEFIPPDAHTCPPATKPAPNGVELGDPAGLPGGCTRDLVHRFYQEQYQIDGGRQDRYAVGSDAAGLTQGHYDTRSLPIYRYLHATGHPNYVLADHFFQAAFGGSFLNHQYLIGARAPEYDTTRGPVPADANSRLDSASFPANNYPLYAPWPGTEYTDGPLTQNCPLLSTVSANGLPVDMEGRACGNFAVNTAEPPWQPSGAGPRLPAINDTDPARPFFETNIGDELSAGGVTWKWYAGGWDNAAGNVGGRGWTNGGQPGVCSDPAHAAASRYPYCPDALFGFHHQPFNYFSAYAPGAPGRAHLADEADFIDAVTRGRLPSVSFVKPTVAESEHPGYASTDSGELHLVDLLRRIEAGPQADRTVVLVTYDEFGGQWDHFAPPGQGNDAGPHDAYGPGTRIPALVIGKPLHRSSVDHTTYDTTSILATIEHRFGLPPLASRDAAVADLRRALSSGAVRN